MPLLFSLNRRHFGLVSEPIDVVLGRLIDEAVAAKRFRSRRHVFELAGLSPGYLNELQSRVAKNPGATLKMDTARSLSAVLGCQLTELAPGPTVDDGSDPYEGRLWAIIAARALGLPESAIQKALAEDPGHDPGRLWWFRRIEMEAESPPSAAKR